jgi:hypothetical protein
MASDTDHRPLPVLQEWIQLPVSQKHQFLKPETNWGIDRQRIFDGCHGYSLVMKLKSTATLRGIKWDCTNCQTFCVRFSLRSRGFIQPHWVVTNFTDHTPECHQDPPSRRALPPRTLARQVRPFFDPPFATQQPRQFTPILRGLNLLPPSLEKNQIHRLTADVRNILETADIPIRQTTSEPYHGALRSLCSLKSILEQHDPDTSLKIQLDANNVYVSSTLIIGAVSRLSLVHSTNQYDVDGAC